MKLEDFKGFELHKPTSGGKAGAGRNKTGSIQVREDNRIVKQFRFKTESIFSQREAIRKAREWCEQDAFAEEEFNSR